MTHDPGEYISRDCYRCGKQIRKTDEAVRGVGCFHWREWHFECYAEMVAEEDAAERLADDAQFGAGAYRSEGRAVAHAWVGGRYLNHHAHTLPLAIKRLNAEIDKRSIGLFGDDEVKFQVES